MGWYELAKEVCGDKLSVIWVGNKSDLDEKREISHSEMIE